MAASISTIGDLGGAYRLYGVCNACAHMERLNLRTFAQALGQDFPLRNIKARIRCKQCQSKDCGIRIVWAGNE